MSLKPVFALAYNNARSVGSRGSPFVLSNRKKYLTTTQGNHGKNTKSITSLVRTNNMGAAGVGGTSLPSMKSRNPLSSSLLCFRFASAFFVSSPLNSVNHILCVADAIVDVVVVVVV